MYGIKETYKHRTNAQAQDTRFKGDEYQDDIYRYAREFADMNNFRIVADVGCGSGYKLVKYFDDCHTTGYEKQLMVDHLKKTYPGKRWRLSGEEPEKAEMVICIDVIEHVDNPDELLDYLHKIAKYKIISTPDRDTLDRLYKWGRNGPPHNKYHVREWSFREFYYYIKQRFEVIDHIRIERYQQVILCR